MKIVTEYYPPPIPVRHFDWSAWDDDTYDVDCDQDGFFSLGPIGHGATEAEAVADLTDRLDEIMDARRASSAPPDGSHSAERADIVAGGAPGASATERSAQ